MRVGTVILCVMDFVDIILPVSLLIDTSKIKTNIIRRPNFSSTWGIAHSAILHSVYLLFHGSLHDMFYI